jgi:sigma-B regulation protein RsbU (phosphoserine phosphatase)
MEWRGEFKNKKKNGDLYWESASISPYRNQEGRITHFVAVKEDITDRKKAEETLKSKNEAMEQELQYAQMIIKQILPASVPDFVGLSMEYRYRPLEAIGGDLFLYNEIDDDHLGVFLGDVTGHGVSAALFLALVKSSIDRISRQHGGQPVALLQQLNRELYASMASYFLTAIYGVFSRDSGGINFTFARGGHCPPILYRAETGSARLVSPSGKPIGVFDNITIEEARVTLLPGDRIYLYTDGIHEVMNSKKEMLGFEGLLDIVLDQRSLPLRDSMDAIIQRVREFQEGSVEEDDVVLMGFECSKKNS